MANLKDIAATLAILGSGALIMSGCGKDKPASEVPGGAEGAGEAGEASCSGEKAEGSCSGAAGEGSCSGEKAEGSFSGDAGEGSWFGAGEEAAEWSIARIEPDHP
ncbi:MAG: hypothetical protein KDK70_39985, partial [Myxococcales bacterium]|nr:hypothetical protein [Myxococcales bacterium]